MLKKTKGEKLQMSSFGQASRRPPPAKPQPMANGRAPNSPAANEPGQEGAFEGQVRCLVGQQQAGDDAGREGDDQAAGECQTIRPVPLLEDQDAAETPVARQHGGERRHDGQLDDERGEEELRGG